MVQQKHIPNPRGGPNIIRYLEVGKIQVPELRVTSRVDDHIMEELRESVKRNGILQPLQVAKVDDSYVLEDGLHRLLVAKELGIPRVPCLVHESSERDLIIRNLVLNRQRGKSNPSHEAQVIRHLVENEKLSIDGVANLCGLSPSWVSKLLKVSYLPSQVLNLVEDGSLSVSAAEHLTKLPDPEQQIQTARDAVNWKYTEEQVKVRVQELLNVRPEPQPGETVFDESGRPTIIPITCYFCHAEVQRGDGYIWICDNCRELVNRFWEAYISQSPPPQPPIEAPTPRRKVLTVDGWRDA